MKQKLEHIDQLLPVIADKPEIIVIDKGDYKVVDYLYVDRDTFTGHPLLLECRGSKFAPDGRIIARPFHKFFNIGEKQQADDIDWCAGHHLTDKLDGSMIHSAVVKGHFRFMTRKGITDIAYRVEEQFLRDYTPLLNDMNHAGYTPIFEYTAPDNRIVIKYAEPKLTLLAARHLITGKYMYPGVLASIAAVDDIPVLDCTRGGPESTPAQLATVRQMVGKEGVVIRFDDGHMLKLKADDYVMKHRVLDDLGSKKKVVALVLADGVDDILPVLDEVDRQELLAFRDAVNHQLTTEAKGILRTIDVLIISSRKNFAEWVVRTIAKNWRSVYFNAYDGKDVRKSLKGMFTRNPDLIYEKWRDQ